MHRPLAFRSDRAGRGLALSACALRPRASSRRRPSCLSSPLPRVGAAGIPLRAWRLAAPRRPACEAAPAVGPPRQRAEAVAVRRAAGGASGLACGLRNLRSRLAVALAQPSRPARVLAQRGAAGGPRSARLATGAGSGFAGCATCGAGGAGGVPCGGAGMLRLRCLLLAALAAARRWLLRLLLSVAAALAVCLAEAPASSAALSVAAGAPGGGDLWRRSRGSSLRGGRRRSFGLPTALFCPAALFCLAALVLGWRCGSRLRHLCWRCGSRLHHWCWRWRQQAAPLVLAGRFAAAQRPAPGAAPSFGMSGLPGATGAPETAAVGGPFCSPPLPRPSRPVPAMGAGGGSAVGGAALGWATTLTTGAGARGRPPAIPCARRRRAACPAWRLKLLLLRGESCRRRGGAVRATTGRSNRWRAACQPWAAAPRTLLSVGATAATAATGALATISRVTRTAERFTGCDCTNAVVGTATIAPGTCRLAYVTLVTFVLL